jgi:hypothetical protein
LLNSVIRNTIRFFALLFIQVLIVKNIDLGRFINPYIYVLFIIMLPFEIPGLLLLFLAFCMGLAIDMFYDTFGMHAAASVFMAFCRPRVYRFFSPREGYEVGTEPGIKNMGTTWFTSCALILILLHHLVLFYIEVFRFSEFFSTFFRVLMSTLFSLGLCLLSLYLLDKKKIRE